MQRFQPAPADDGSRVRVMEVIARLNVGGPATQVMGLYEGLDRDRFDHRLYTGGVGEGECDSLRLRDATLAVHDVPGLSRSVRPSDDLRALVSLVAAVREFRPHVVYTRTTKAGVLGRIAARVSGVRCARAHVFHGHLLHGYFTGAKRAVYVRTERRLAALSHRLVTVGTAVRDDLLREGIGRPEQYTVIPPGVPARPCPDPAAARRDLGLPPGVPVVAYVGRLTGVKRPDRLAATAELVLRRLPECRFVVCGGGDLREDLERRTARLGGSVRLLGWRQDVETVYAAADVVLLTSDNEGTPLTLAEAGMAGRPVVSTRVGSVAEVVRDGETGLLAATDPAELAAHTVRLLTDPALARRMGEAGRRWTTSAYGVDRLVADTEALYLDLHRSLGAVPSGEPATR
ncbi:glycosyltransferase [Microbispora sp. ATCC PTA-5024]|uniref:glycosyltransferase n=1 Tax=Microbispora sp. ATCC PTA-5024 TaxID=316330 RepID=UPI0003DDD92F|nr:glycosyltransferase [Microbispora sp. ATCC PTA-5024]ETK33487.1 glycosyl transferase [Microbispora sp. ATCC PTA-5024]